MTESEKDRRLAQLERELEGVREYMRAALESHEAVQEELRSADEEMLSANEEFQSTNEELETAKEDLQSTNEELTVASARRWVARCAALTRVFTRSVKPWPNGCALPS